MSLWNPANIMDVPSYPPDRFHGVPEHRASLRYATDREDYAVGPTKFHYLVSQQKSGGDYGLYRVEMGPHAGGAAAHYHRGISEAFYILDGNMLLFDGDNWVEATTGDFLYVPPGSVHGFRNDADTPAEVLVLFSPGAPRESYFEGLAHIGSLTDEQRREWNFRHDSYFL